MLVDFFFDIFSSNVNLTKYIPDPSLIHLFISVLDRFPFEQLSEKQTYYLAPRYHKKNSRFKQTIELKSRHLIGQIFSLVNPGINEIHFVNSFFTSSVELLVSWI